MFGVIRKQALWLILLAGLAGCFASKDRLILPHEADFPFQSMTFVAADGEEQVTLVRRDDGYVSTKEDSKEVILFKLIEADTYVGQMSFASDGGLAQLYGVIRFAPDRKSFEVIRGIAEESDIQAAKAGEWGFHICEEDSDFVCIADIEAYARHALAPGGEANIIKLTILKFQ